MPKIRVVVVDDSLTARKHLVEVLRADGEFEVAGEAEDGKQAIELCAALRPDVITLDMMLPVLSGVDITEHVMAYFPTPILIVSSSTNRGELYKTYDALAAGAVDVFEKPSGKDPDGVWERGFVSTVKMVARIRVITHIRGKLGSTGRVPIHLPSSDSSQAPKRKRIIAIGGSTGAPGAIVQILRELPAGFPVPILLIIHIGELFSAEFAAWLNGQSALRVHYAKDGEAVPALGQSGVVMAPPGCHLVVRGTTLRLTSDPDRNSCRPSIDVLFESLAVELGRETVACLLTGMGKDGASGLLALRHAGAHTIAQDEASSVIFGMPKEAIQLGAVDRVLALDQISGALAGAACETVSGRAH